MERDRDRDRDRDRQRKRQREREEEAEGRGNIQYQSSEWVSEEREREKARERHTFGGEMDFVCDFQSCRMLSNAEEASVSSSSSESSSSPSKSVGKGKGVLFSAKLSTQRQVFAHPIHSSTFSDRGGEAKRSSVVACLSKDATLVVWNGDLGHTLYCENLVTNVPAFKGVSAKSFQSIALYDTWSNRGERGGGEEEGEKGKDKSCHKTPSGGFGLVLATDSDLYFLPNVCGSHQEVIHLAGKKIPGANKGFATMQIVDDGNALALMNTTGKANSSFAPPTSYLVLGCNNHTIKILCCRTHQVLTSLEFTKSSVPSIICSTQFVPIAPADLDRGASSKPADVSLFAAATDGNIGCWRMETSALSPSLTPSSAKKQKDYQAQGLFKLGKSGIFNCFVKPSSESQGIEINSGQNSPAVRSYSAFIAYAFAQDGYLHVLQCVDTSGKLVFGNKAVLLAKLSFISGDLKKVNVHCDFMSNDMFTLLVKSKQSKNAKPVEVQFLRVRFGRNAGGAELQKLKSFDLQKEMESPTNGAKPITASVSPMRRSPSLRGTKNGESDLKVHCLNATSRRVVIGTNIGMLSFTTILEEPKKMVTIALNQSTWVAYASAVSQQLAIERLNVAEQQGGAESPFLPVQRIGQQSFVQVPSEINLQDHGTAMEPSATRRFLSLHDKETKGLVLYAIVNTGEEISMIQLHDQMDQVTTFAWHALDDTRCVCIRSQKIQFLGISQHGDQSQPKLEVIAEMDANSILGAQALSLHKGPCLGVLSQCEKNKTLLKFTQWATGSSSVSSLSAEVENDLGNVCLSEFVFMEWSNVIHYKASGSSICFCAIGYNNCVLFLCYNGTSLSYSGKIVLDDPQGCLWQDTSLLINTVDGIYIAHVSGANPMKSRLIPTNVQPVHGLLDFKRLHVTSHIIGKFKLLHYSAGKIWCVSEQGQVFVAQLLNKVDRLKLELEVLHNVSLEDIPLTTEDKRKLFFYVCKSGRLGSFPSLLSYSSCKLDQVWGLYTYEPLKALCLAIHYIKEMIKDIDQGSVSLTMLGAQNMSDLLLAARKISTWIGSEEAVKRLDDCEEHIALSLKDENGGLGKKCSQAITDFILLQPPFKGEEDMDLPNAAGAKETYVKLVSNLNL